MAKGAVLVVANRRHVASTGVGLVARATFLPFQSAQWPIYAAQRFAVEVDVSLVVEPKRSGVPQAACPPRAKRRVVRVKRGDPWVERVPAVDRPQVAVASSTLIFRDKQQSLLSLVILVTVRAIPHVSGDLLRVMWSDDLWTHDTGKGECPFEDRGTVPFSGRRGLVEKPTMTLSARPIHHSSGRVITRHFLPATPSLE